MKLHHVNELTYETIMLTNFQKKEINTILGDIIKHVTPDRAYEDFYPQLQSVVSKIMAHQHDFSLLFSLVSYILPFYPGNHFLIYVFYN